ncbi:hypothetical protein ID866_9578 [Astraeus odoratus]|nr:hypothetical protein ID866_9578 [Astraeus odoratus]
MNIITNQTTPLHRNCSSVPSLIDLIVSLGFHNIHFDILNHSNKFVYLLSTIIWLSRKLLQYEVPKWNKEERIALAHYMKNAVHNKLHVERSPFIR